jgi:hypothetical protein
MYVWFPEYYLSSVERLLYINDTLVGGTSEKQVRIVELLYERPVHQHVEQFQQFSLRSSNQRLKGKPRITPDILVRTSVDGPGQIRKAVTLLHRIAPREGHIGIRVSLNNLHQLLRGHLPTAFWIPRLGIMTARALVSAPRTIDGGPESRTIHHRIFYHIENPNHFS